MAQLNHFLLILFLLKVYSQCDSNCLTCSGPDKTDCLTCHSLHQINRWGLCQCQTGYYLDQLTMSCQQCHITCENCYGPSYDNCLSCFHIRNRKIINDECLCISQSNYSDLTDGYCKECHVNCKTCTGPSQNECLSCSDSKILTIVGANKTCECPNGSIGTMMPFGIWCEQCYPRCSTCIGLSSTSCASCVPHGSLNSSNACICDFGYFENGRSCSQCDNNCETCQTTSTTCLTCKTNFELTSNSCICTINRTGSDCSQFCTDSDCLRCKQNDGNYCLQCQNSKIVDNGICKCQSEQFVDALGQCQNCMGTCSACTALNACQSCHSGFYGTQCQSNCDPFSFCASCSGNASTCTSCTYPFVLSGSSCICDDGYHFIGTGCVAYVVTCPANCVSCKGVYCSDCDSFVRIICDSCLDTYTDAQCASSCPVDCKTCDYDLNCTSCWYPQLTGDCTTCIESTSLNTNCSCKSHHYSIGLYQCGVCDNTCEECNASNINCTSCYNALQNRYLVSNQCLCNTGLIPGGYIGICIDPNCGYGCLQCIGTTCSTCITGNVHRQNIPNQNCPCQDNYYENSQSVCLQCPSECLKCNQCGTCIAPSCTECKDNTRDINNNCQCIVGYYENAGICMQCMIGCLSCLDSTTCLQCYNNYILDNYAKCQCPINNHSTNCECQSGYYLDYYTYSCQPCNSNCQTCSLYPDNCTSCSINRFNIPFCQCSPTFFEQDSECLPCAGNCEQCANSFDQCSTCPIHKIQILSTQCVCPSGYYDIQYHSECYQCDPICSQCEYKSNNCTLCAYNRINEPFCNCPPSTQHLDYSQPCQQCNNKCQECAVSVDNCTICSSNRTNPPICNCIDGYFENVSQLCQQCSQQCQSCVISSNNCIVCSLNRENSPLCKCKSGYYENSITLTCELCHISCKECNGGNANNCLSCDSSQFRTLSDNNECICPETYYSDVPNSNKCIKCSSSCKKCEKQQNNCTICETNRINLPNCICPMINLELIYDQECQKCQSQCLTCLYAQDNCVSCSPSRINPPSCSKCNIGYYEVAQDCVKCNVQCKTCQNSSNHCTECSNSLRSFAPICACKDGYYSDESGDCLPCHSSCQSCFSNTKNSCLTCGATRNLINQECQCKFGYYESDDTCKVCTLSVPQCLKRICGDAIKLISELCDDGNLNDRDGCSSQCEIEEQFYCTTYPYVSQLETSICFQCPENCKSCNQTECLECMPTFYLNQNRCKPCNYHCLTCTGPLQSDCRDCIKGYDFGFPKKCQFCEEYVGLYQNENECVSKCGDGVMISDYEECDDGNQLNNDGCSTECIIEQDYWCYSIQKSQSTCQKLNYSEPTLTFESKYDQYSNIRVGQLLFSIPMFYETGVELTWIYSINNYSQFIYNLSLIQDANNYLIGMLITLTLNETITTDCLLNIDLSPYLIRDIVNNLYIKETQLSAEFGCYVQISQQQKEITEQSMVAGNTILYLYLAILILGILLSNLDFFWNLLDSLQIISYYYYFNVQFPYIVEQYLDIFSFARFDFLQGILQIEWISQQNNEFQQDYPFLILKDVNANLLINSQSILFLALFTYLSLLICKLLLTVICQLTKLISVNQVKTKDSFANYIKLKYFQIIYSIQQASIEFIQAFYYKILVRIFISGIYDYNFCVFTTIYCSIRNTYFTKIEMYSLIAVAILLFFELLILYFLGNSISFGKATIKSQYFNQYYSSLYEGFNNGQFDNRQLAFIMLIKRLCFISLLILLFDDPAFQVGSIASLQLFSFTYFMNIQPFQDKLEQFKNYITETSLLLTMILIIYYYIQQKMNITDQNIFEISGYVHIGIYSFMLSICLLIDIYSQIKFAYQNSKTINILFNKCKRNQIKDDEDIQTIFHTRTMLVDA